MKRFLGETANYLFSKHGNQLHRITVVFPNRRAGVFFSGYLRQLVEKPLFTPRIVTINELIESFSVLNKTDNITLLFRLYRIYRKVTGSNESFDDFYFWGEMLINDFNDLDKYRVNAKDLFRNISNLKEIDALFDYLTDGQKTYLRDFWGNIGRVKESENRDGFIAIWKVLNDIYSRFRSELERRGEAYEGMLYRAMADKISNGDTVALSEEKYVFIGFNALNPCEKQLFDFLRNHKRAEFFWDYDEYYTNSIIHEAGLFMRENLKSYPMPSGFVLEGSFSNNSRIKVVSVPSSTGQGQAVAELMKRDRLPLNGNFDTTAVVLGEESLLLPTLSALPSEYEKINVTMGYPLTASPVHGFIRSLVKLQKNARNSSGISFYYKDVLAILYHPVLQKATGGTGSDWANKIVKYNKIYINQSELCINDLYRLIFCYRGSPTAISTYFLEVFKRLFTGVEKNSGSEIIHEYLYQAYVAVNKLTDVLTGLNKNPEDKPDFKRDTFFRILMSYLQRIAIPFEGEPLGGLQIMGILETRCLDFENIFLLSVNENVMPSGSTSPSFIPYRLRYGFGLPSIEQMDAMYAYYFYRSIQRSKNVYLLYNPVADGLNNGEMSRYIYQLMFESGIDIEEMQCIYNISGTEVQEIVVGKTPEMIQQLLRKYEEKALSPSALNRYLECSLRFYFKDVAGIEKPDEIKQEIEADVFGNIFHEAMEQLYKPFEGKRVETTHIETMIKDDKLIEKVLHNAFDKAYFKYGKKEVSGELFGRNRLIYGIIKRSVKELLKQDQKIAPFEIIGLEKHAVAPVKINVANHNIQLAVGGYIDRLDRVNGKLRVIDYKTGNDKLDFKGVETLFDRHSSNRPKAVFQTLLYARGIAASFPDEKVIVPGIYQIRDLYNERFNPSISSKDVENFSDIGYYSVADDLDHYLKVLIAELFDTSMPFSQVDVKKQKCSYCPYAAICHRPTDNNY